MNFEILGICYDKTQTLRRGAALAPQLLKKSFPKIETFINNVELTEEAFVKDLGNIHPKNFFELIRQTKQKLRNTKFPIIIGGEHTISFAVLSSLPIKSFVCFDAHPDCENSDKHDGVVRRIAEAGIKNIFLYGVHCFSKKEHDFLKRSKIKIVRSPNQLKAVPHPAYLSIDFDVLDPALMPTVGNPELSGLSFQEVIKAVRIVAPKIIAIDFVEFTPLRNSDLNEIYALLAGKLIYSAIAEIIKARG